MSDPTQTVLDISPVKNLRRFYLFCVTGATISLVVCVLFILVLVFNYFAPWRLDLLQDELERHATPDSQHEVGSAPQEDFVLDGPQDATETGDAEDAPDDLTLSERFPFAFLTLPTEHKAFLELREQLLRTPGDTDLQTRVRAMDLILRRQYFARRARARTGSFLFLASTVVGLMFAATASSIKRRIPRVDTDSVCDHRRQWSERQYKLKSLATLGILGGLGTGMIFGLLLSGRSELESFLANRMNVPEPVGKTEVSTATSKGSSLPAPGDSLAPNGSKQAVVPVEEPPVDPSQDRDKFLEVWNRNWGSFRGPLAGGISEKEVLTAFNPTAEGRYATTWNEATGENILWKSPVPLPGHNSPVVWGERLFLTGADENERKIFCFHTKTGKLLWETPVPNIGEKIKAESLNADTGFAAPTVATDGQRVYAIFPNADVVAADYTGKIVWSKNLGNAESQYGYSSSLALWFDRILVQLDVESEDESKESARLLALSTRDGQELWKTVRSDIHSSWASPIVQYTGNRWQAIVMGDPYLASYDPESGKELWRYTGFKTDVAVSPVALETVVYAAHTFPNFAAIDATGKGELAKTAKTLWTADSSGLPNACGPLPIPGGVILLAENGSLTGIDTKEKKTVWELFVDEEDSFYASPVYADNLIFLFAKSEENPHAYVVDASKINAKSIPNEAIDLTEVKGALVKKIPLSKPVFASPALKEGMIFVRTTNELFCIAKKETN